MAHALTTARAKPHLAREEGAPLREQQSGHTSVMVKEVLDLLDPSDGELVLDATLGLGGHAEAILKRAKVKLVGLDADAAAIESSKKRLKRYSTRVALLQGNFRDLANLLPSAGVEKLDKALFDLGWNATQLQSGRGFSFLSDEPLFMSYGENPASGFTAADILNTWSEKGIADALFGYGEERYAKKIAKAIVARRDIAPFKTTMELVEVVRDATPPAYRHGRIHPATRTFQALRIAVNDELGSIEQGLQSAWKMLGKGGRIAAITFHSIEDRLVKRLFASFAKGHGKVLTKKPITPTEGEIKKNPRARSAKLRAIEK